MMGIWLQIASMETCNQLFNFLITFPVESIPQH